MSKISKFFSFVILSILVFAFLYSIKLYQEQAIAVDSVKSGVIIDKDVEIISNSPLANE